MIQADNVNRNQLSDGYVFPMSLYEICRKRRSQARSIFQFNVVPGHVAPRIGRRTPGPRSSCFPLSLHVMKY